MRKFFVKCRECLFADPAPYGFATAVEKAQEHSKDTGHSCAAINELYMADEGPAPSDQTIPVRWN